MVLNLPDTTFDNEQEAVEYITKWTVAIGRDMLNDPAADIHVKFDYSLRASKNWGYCQPDTKTIVFRIPILRANLKNWPFIKHMIIHECAHLVPETCRKRTVQERGNWTGPDGKRIYPTREMSTFHSPEFRALCILYGDNGKIGGGGELAFNRPLDKLYRPYKFIVFCPECGWYKVANQLNIRKKYAHYKCCGDKYNLGWQPLTDNIRTLIINIHKSKEVINHGNNTKNG